MNIFLNRSNYEKNVSTLHRLSNKPEYLFKNWVKINIGGDSIILSFQLSVSRKKNKTPFSSKSPWLKKHLSFEWWALTVNKNVNVNKIVFSSFLNNIKIELQAIKSTCSQISNIRNVQIYRFTDW